MAEITWKDKQCLWIIKVGSKYFTIFISHLFVSGPRYDRHNFNLFTQSFSNIRQMHLNGVLVFLIVNINHVKPFLLFKLVHGCIF